MKSRKVFVYAVIPVLAWAMFFGANSVYARGMFGFGQNATPDEIASRHQEMFQEQATLLGISVEDVKSSWAQGKNIQELAKEKGITAEQLQQKMKDTKIAKMKIHLQALVDKGVITQAQADQRLSFMQTIQDKSGKGMRKGGYLGFGF
jgi:hypothetical protein